MELSNKLKQQGWHFTEDGIKKLSTAANNDERKIISIALDMDFREIAGGALPSKREDTIPGRIVLQLQKTRNISAPKSNEESKAAPRFLQLELSDGQSIIQALELESIASLSLNVPPGTKIYFKAERLQLIQGFIVLRASELQVLGGKVEALVEKWEVARTMQKYARSGHRLSGGTSGPPPWIAFGKKLDNIKDTLPNDRNFKSLQAAGEKDKEVKENEEFNTMRSEAIAEATKGGAKKVFGGGGQQILDHNVKKILEKGYSEEEAKQALRTTNNNLERALYNLKRRQEHNVARNATQNSATTSKTGRNSAPREVGGSKRSGNSNAAEDAVATKPAANVSLFDFLTDKFPANTDAATATKAAPTTNNQQSSQSLPTTTNTSNNYKSEKEKFKPDLTKSNHSSTNKFQEANSSRPKFENNISSSFAANRTGSGTQRSEREVNTNADRGRSSNYRGAHKGSRGGAHMPYRSNHKMQDDEARNTTENERNMLRVSSTNNNANSHNNANNRNNRNSNERALPTQRNSNNNHTNANKERNHAEDESSRFDNRRNQNYQKSNRGNERHANSNENKNYERNRHSQKDNSSRKHDENRTQNINSANNTVPPTTTNAATKATANNNNFSNNSKTSSHNNTEHAARMNKLVDATAKMKIDKTREQTGNSNQQQSTQRQQKNQQQHRTQQQAYNQTATQPQQQQQQQPIISHFVPPRYVQPPMPTAAPNQRNYSQLPYDLSKIIGFQNKQTNDFAMSLLKSQGMSNSMPNAPQAHKAQPTSAPPMQPPSPFAANQYVMPNQQNSLPPPHTANAQFGLVPSDAWLFKLGDLCLAKYWDDGRYYEAEITAIADKTCVVFFLGYGNHEEVLKTDCLPYTDVINRPINNYNPMQQQQAVNIAPMQTAAAAAPPPPIQTSQRYRAERQMYVPPHKRDN